MVALTEREFDVLCRFEKGYSNREIAEELYLTVGTVKWYAQQIYNKLGVSNRGDAVDTAQTLGLLTPETQTELLQDTPNNLPAAVSSFIGREDLINQVLLQLSQSRLLTLTGTGGTGKTRLALRVAEMALHDYPDGVFFINLGHLQDASNVLNEIGRILNLRITQEQSIKSSLQHLLANLQCLLVIDNFEHVIDAAPALVDLLHVAPDLKILVTSREALSVSGEYLFSVPPMTLPIETASSDEAKHSEAIALFVERAQAIRSDFTLDDNNVEDVIAICHRLDGLPLALELAASRIRLFSPKMLRNQLQNPINLLTSGTRDNSERHRTLYNAIHWSYQLLTEDEQRLFTQLAIFAGGASFEAISVICSELSPLDLINTLNSLVDKSLVRQYDDNMGEARFQLLATIRDYAQEQMDMLHSFDALMQRFATYYLSLTQQDMTTRQRRIQCLQIMQQENQNLRAIFHYLMDVERYQDAIELTNALYRHWIRRAPAEGLKYIEAILSAIPNIARQDTELLTHATSIALDVGAFDKGKVYHSDLKALADKTGNHQDLGRVYAFEAFLYQEDGLEQIESRLREALTHFEVIDDAEGIGWVKGALGVLAMMEEDYDRANDIFQESYDLVEQAGNDRFAAGALLNLGLNNIQRNDLETAKNQLQQSIALDQQVGTYDGIANSLVGLAGIAHKQEDWHEVAHLLAITDIILERLGVILDYPERDYYDEYRAILSEQLSPDNIRGVARKLKGQSVETVIRSYVSQIK